MPPHMERNAATSVALDREERVQTPAVADGSEKKPNRQESLPPRYFTPCCNVLTRWVTCPRCRKSPNPPPAPHAKRRREEDETPRQPSRPEGSPSAPPTEYHPGTSKLGKNGKHWVVGTAGPRRRHVWEPAPPGFRPPPPRETPPVTSGANLALIEGRRKLPPRSSVGGREVSQPPPPLPAWNESHPDWMRRHRLRCSWPDCGVEREDAPPTSTHCPQCGRATEPQ